MIVPVILAGGAGTRLWPLSRRSYPKQFLRLLNEQSLLQNTILRLQKMDLPCFHSIVWGYMRLLKVPQQPSLPGVSSLYYCNLCLNVENIKKNIAE